MDKDVHGGAAKPRRVAVPKFMRLLVLALEVGLVVLLAYFLAQFLFQVLEDRKVAYSPIDAVAVTKERTDFASLTTFDPFYRQIQDAPVEQVVGAVPETSLRIEVFGLRAAGEGRGSAILKMQDGEQKLVRVGEDVARGVELTGVFVDRLEISRNGIREAVYLRPQNVRAVTSAPAAARQVARPAGATSSAQVNAVVEQLLALNMEAVRRNRRIIGFRLPEVLPTAFQLAGLEAQDILLSVNGSPMASHERIEEIAEEAAGAAQLVIEVERRGERRQLSLNLKGTG